MEEKLMSIIVAEYGPYKATCTKIVDGYTALVKINLGFNQMFSAYCRVSGIKVDPLNTPTGKASRDQLQKLLPVNATCKVLSHSWDSSVLRFVGTVTLSDGSDLGQAMIDSGKATPINAPPSKSVNLKASHLSNS